MIMALITVCVNIACSLALFPFLGHVGIAIATAISAWVNVALLVLGLRGFWKPDSKTLLRLPRMLLAALLMGAALWGMEQMTGNWFEGATLFRALGLAMLILAGVAVYFTAALALKATSMQAIKAGFTRR